MEKYILIIGILFLLSGCSGEKIEEMRHPEDLAGKKELLRKKKADLKEATAFIEKLEKEIADLDTTRREKPRALVTTDILRKRDFKRYTTIQAAVQAEDVVSVSSETGGRILQQDFKEGDYIEEGTLIARIDLESVNKQIAELETRYKLAVDTYDRQKRLWDQKIGSEMQYLQAKNNKESMEKSMETLRHQLTKVNVYAPVSGYVDMVFAKTGEMAGPGAPILHLLNMSRMKVVADVPENYLRAIKKGEKVSLYFPALELEKTGRVSLIGRTINPANRTFKVEVKLSNNRKLLKPNLLAEMKINDFTEKDAIVVPLDLIQQEVSGNDYVFVKAEGDEGAFAKKVYVVTGESAEGEIIISSGLDGTEEIIVEGAHGLSDKELLKIQPVAVKKNDGKKILKNG